MEPQLEITHVRATARRRPKLYMVLSLVVLAIAGLAILSAHSDASAEVAKAQFYAPAASMTPIPAGSRYSLLTIKPFGIEGVVNELSLQVWGPYSWRNGGDAYSPLYDPSAGGPTSPNPWHDDQPYGYLYRVDIPASFADDELVVQIFDADNWNNQADISTPTRTPTTQLVPSGTPTSTPQPMAPVYAYDSRFFWCAQTLAGGCTSNDTNFDNSALRLDGYRRADWTQAPWTYGRPAVWRFDEYRQPNTAGSINPPADSYNANWPTETNFTLWHFNANITNPFGNPSMLSDQPGGAPVRPQYTARYETDMNGNYTDLAWIEPWTTIKLNDPGCSINGNDCFAREADGSFHFYIYVSSSMGSSENDFDIRVGPKDANYAAGYNCRTVSQRWSPSYTNICYANEQYFQQSISNPTLPDWTTGGAKVSAARSLPLNVATGAAFPMLLSQLEQDSAGESLSLRHFDQDCSFGCGTPVAGYQLQYCVDVNTTNLCSTGNCEPCSSLLNPACFGTVANTYQGPNNEWYCVFCPNPESVNVPAPGTPAYAQFFGPNGECSTSWLRLKQNTSYVNDNTVWEVIRPALTTTPIATNTPANTNTATGTPTATVNASETAGAQQTATSFAATVIAGWTQTALAQTPTSTATFTRTQTSTNTPTNIPSNTPTNTPVNTSTPTLTHTPIPTNTSTLTRTPTNTPSNTATNTSTNTPTNTITQTPSNTPTGTRTPTDTPTITPTNTSTNTATNTSTITPTNIPTSTQSNTATNTVTQTPSNTPTGTQPPTNTSTSTPTNTPSETPTNTPTLTGTSTAAATDTPIETATTVPSETATSIPTATVTLCTIAFSDVPPDSTFYSYIICLACRGIVGGYPCSGPGEPCNGTNDPYFRPSAPVTRGQLAKIVSQSAGFNDVVPATQQTFEDVAPLSTFWVYVERLAMRGVMSGYACGGAGEPCGPASLPYFRPASNATRGQLAKIVSNAAGFNDTIPAGLYTFTDIPETNTFHPYVERLLINRPGAIGGYPCGAPSEPCDSNSRPYFRPSNTLTRGQTAKIVANTFFPGCSTLSNR